MNGERRPTPARGQVLAGRYVVGERIGKGAASVVYRAFDQGLQTWIAIKVLDTQRWADMPEPLFRELRHAREIQHPHVCRLYDVVAAEAGTPPFLTMALAEGGSLRDTLATAPDRPLRERLADVEGVLSGLAALHAAGVIHRDIKPENVLRMGDGRVVLSDFGLAIAPDRATHVSAGVGTPVYMAPELRLGAPADARSDVWSLGLLMQETVLGVRTPGALPAGLATRERRTIERLKALCQRCLEVEPDRRPADARQVLEQFQRLDRSRWLPLGRTAQRRALVGLAVAALGLVAAAVMRRSSTTRPEAEGLVALVVAGQPQPLVERVRLLAEFEGRVHCLLALADGSLGVVWGEPRRAERLYPRTGARTAWDVPAASYQLPPADFPDPLDNNCPQIAPDGQRLLYWGEGAGKQRAVFLQESPTAPPAMLTAGSMPVWHPAGHMIALRLDDQHPGVFNLPNRHLTVLPKPREHRALMVLQVAFDEQGRHLLVRSGDAAGEYAITRYDVDRLRPVQGILARRPAGSPQILRLTMGAAWRGDLLVHATLPGGAYGLAALRWQAPGLRWLAELQPLDITASIARGVADLTLVARRWTTELQALRDGTPVRTVVSETPVTVADATARGDVVVQTDQAGRIVVQLYPADGAPPRLIGAGPLDSVPQFTGDGQAVLFGRTERDRGQDRFMLCGLDGDCRSLGAVPSADFPALSPARDQVAYIAWSPYTHVAMFDVGAGASRILVASLPCTPRWLGDHVWVAQGAGGAFAWVEHQASSGRATGRQVPGKGSCGAAGPGPEGVLRQRLRIVQRESSRLLSVAGDLP